MAAIHVKKHADPIVVIFLPRHSACRPAGFCPTSPLLNIDSAGNGFRMYIFPVRIAKAKVPLAELRVIIGMSQAQMAQLLGVSLPAIHAIETRRMRISERLARRAAFETDASWSWLHHTSSSGKIRPPVDRRGRPYTKEVFLRRRAEIQDSPGGNGEPAHVVSDISFLAMRIAILLAAVRDPREYALIRYNIFAALEEEQRKYGANIQLGTFLMGPPHIRREIVALAERLDPDAVGEVLMNTAQTADENSKPWAAQGGGISAWPADHPILSASAIESITAALFDLPAKWSKTTKTEPD